MPSPQNQLIGEVPWRDFITTSDFLESNIIASPMLCAFQRVLWLADSTREKDRVCSFQLYEATI